MINIKLYIKLYTKSYFHPCLCVAEEPRGAKVDQDIIFEDPVFPSDKDVMDVRKRDGIHDEEGYYDWFKRLAQDHGKEVGFLIGYHMSKFKIRDPSKRPYWWRESLELETLNAALLDTKKMKKDLVTTQKDGMFFIRRVVVDEEHRGHDIGLKLMEDTMECLREYVGCCAILPFPVNTHTGPMGNHWCGLMFCGPMMTRTTRMDEAEQVKEKMAKLGCHFSKIGFRQCGKESPQAQFWLVKNEKGKGCKPDRTEPISLDSVSLMYVNDV